MKHFSLRMRLTLLVSILLIAISILLTFLAVYNAGSVFVSSFTASGESGEAQSLPVAEEESKETSATVYATGETTLLSSEATLETSLADFLKKSLIPMIAAIVGGSLLSWFLIGLALKPLHSLSIEVNSITENKLYSRLEERQSRDEISSLTNSFNAMLVRLGKVFSDQKRFSSDAAHELKTPLTTVKTTIDVLEADNEPDPKEYQWAIKVVKHQNDRMIRLVDDLFSVASQRSYDLSDSVDVGALLTDIAAQLKPRLEEKNISLNLPRCSYQTKANRVMLTQAFTNLIDNAIKYNVEGGSIDVAVKKEQSRYVFTITDTGIGIPEENQDLIFEPFYRVNESRSRKIAGAGLGLAITKEIIERHEGHIEFTSQKGKTSFIVFLPHTQKLA